MKKMKIYNPAITLLLTTFVMIFFGGGPGAYAQKTTDAAALQQAGSSVSRGFPFADGRAGMSEKEKIACGPASRNPTYYAQSILHKIDLSFATIPPGDRLGDTERIIGSWAVRAIFPAEAGRPETVSNIYFHGGFTSGSVTQAKGGARVFDLYGTTGFTGSMCLMQSGGDTQRRYVRISGVCGGGAGEEVRFEVSTRPAVDQNGIVYFNESDIFASGRFRGNITCGTTTDRTRVRTNLTSD